MLLYPIIKWISHWNTICVFIFILPLAILLLMSIFIVETPEFLYIHKNYDECLEALNKIARFNGKPELLSIEPSQTHMDKKPEKITDTFTKAKFLIPLIVLSFAQISNNGIYYATQYSLSQLGLSFELNMLLIGSLELISCLVTNFYCERMERKRFIMLFMVLSGSIGLIIQFTKTESIIELILIGFSRLLNSFGFALFSLITTESFPSSIRSTGTGVSEAMSNLGNIMAPFLVTLGDEIGVKGIFLSGILCILGGISMSFVKETKPPSIKAGNPLIQKEDEDYENEEDHETVNPSTSVEN